MDPIRDYSEPALLANKCFYTAIALGVGATMISYMGVNYVFSAFLTLIYFVPIYIEILYIPPVRDMIIYELSFCVFVTILIVISSLRLQT